MAKKRKPLHVTFYRAVVRMHTREFEYSHRIPQKSSASVLLAATRMIAKLVALLTMTFWFASGNSLAQTPITSGFTKIAAGNNHTCAINTAGGVKCWGANGSGQLGDTTTNQRLSPVDVSGLTSGILAITAGVAHTCALTSGGAVRCWGQNIFGQLGDSTSGTNRLAPVAVSGLSSGVIAIAAGDSHTCALTSGGGVKCWGSNGSGQIGDSTSGSNRLAPVDVLSAPAMPALSGISEIAAHGFHTCARTNSGGVKCWGENFDGALGDGTIGTRLTPVDVLSALAMPALAGIAAIETGSFHTCALTTGGGIKCWGRNQEGELGDSTMTQRLTPVNVSTLATGGTGVTAGFQHSCALVSGGVKCWGANNNGQIGDNTSGINRFIPVSVTGLTTGVTAISAGGSHNCALTTGGGIKCWGNNANGQLGDNTSGTNRPAPVAVLVLAANSTSIATNANPVTTVIPVTFTAVVVGSAPTGSVHFRDGSNTIVGCGAASLVSGSAQCTTTFATAGVKTITGQYSGDANNPTSTGVLGGGQTVFAATSTVTPSIGVNASISPSTPQTVAYSLTKTFTITTTPGYTPTVATGAGNCGGILTGTAPNYSYTTAAISADCNVAVAIIAQVPITSGITKIAAGTSHTCVITNTGGLKCWGANSAGQLGDNSFSERHTPVDVVGLTAGITAVTAGVAHTCALTNSGAVKCWGWNAFGQIGDNTSGDVNDRVVPVAVSGLSSGIVAIAAGDTHTCALSSGGGVKCWGDNFFSQIGDNTTGSANNRLTPVDVLSAPAMPALSDIIAIAAGGHHTCALTSGGGVKCWGNNFAGELGDNSRIDRLTPVDVFGLVFGVTRLALGNSHSCALVGGGAKCWGDSQSAQLGDGVPGLRSLTPVDVISAPAMPALAGVTTIALGGIHTCALASGVAKCWGANASGQLGDNSLIQRPTPTNVASLSVGVIAMAAGYSHTCALTSSGGVKCWGNNFNGQSGDGSTVSRLTPTDVLTLATDSTSLSSSANPVVAGVSVTFTATVIGTTPSGTINFRDGGVTITGCGAKVLTSGSAQCTTTFATAGTKIITAVYSGDASNANGTGLLNGGQVVIITVPDAPIIGVATAGIGSVSVTFGPPVSNGGSNITGYTATCGSQSNTGVASPIVVTGLTGGVALKCTVTASNVVGSGPDSAASNLVTPASPSSSSTTVSSSVNPSLAGNAVTFTAVVTGVTPTGTINFKAGGTTISGCGAVALASASATCLTSFATAATRLITADYSGNGANLPSTGTLSGGQVVNKAAPTVAVTGNGTSTVGTNITFTATMSGGTGPTGSVTFKTGGINILACSALTLAGNVATCTTNSLPVGNASITAVYSGDTNNATATSLVVTQIVNAATQTVTFAPASPVVFGTPAITLTATASSGLTVFTFSTSSLASICTVLGNQLTIVGGGTCALTASQAGNSNVASAFGNATVVIIPASQTLTFAPAPAVNVGVSPITLTASASSGLTAFTFSTTSLSTICTVLSNQLTIVGAGTCALTATQTGNANYASASASANVVINALVLLAVQSRKTHGSAGPFDLLIDRLQPLGGVVTVEPRRIGSGHTIVFQFNGAVSAEGNVSVAPVGSATASHLGNEVLVTLTNVPDNRRVTITLTNVNGSFNPSPVSMGFLLGDVNNSRAVNPGDVSGVKSRSGQAVSPFSFQFDVNASGTINAADIAATKARPPTPLVP